MVEYRYDAWGKLLAITGSMADTLGKYNPFRYRGYIYDDETGLYWLTSRYYNPEWKRFINADVTSKLGTNRDLTRLNLFAYCGNNPVIRKDESGCAWETIFDVLSLGASILEVAFNPADPFAWLGLAGDAVDLIPFVTGVGETIRALKTGSKIVDGGEVIIDSYTVLRKLNAGNGLEVHHIIEKRFVKWAERAEGIEKYNWKPGEMPSIVLEKDVHRKYTQDWRNLKYGKGYSKKAVLELAIDIYSKNPHLLGAAIYTLVK